MRDWPPVNVIEELVNATADLPQEIARPLRVALTPGRFSIGAGSWESELAVCPIAAAALVAGVWHDGGIVERADVWGTPDGPSDAVEEFAAWFDVCAEELGLSRAIRTVRATLGLARCRARCRRHGHATMPASARYAGLEETLAT